MISRVVHTNDAIEVKLSQNGRRVGLAEDVHVTVEQTNRIYQQGAIVAEHGQSLDDREAKVMPIIRFTTLKNKYHSFVER